MRLSVATRRYLTPSETRVQLSPFCRYRTFKDFLNAETRRTRLHGSVHFENGFARFRASALAKHSAIAA